MAKSDVPLVATGDWIDAAWLNQYLRDNIAAIWVGTAAGDLDYYTSAIAKARLAKPASPGILTMPTTGVPAYLQGGVGNSQKLVRVKTDGTWELTAAPFITLLTGSGNQVVAAAGPILWATEILDDGNWHSTVTNTSRITVAETGRYRVSINIGIWTLTGGTTTENLVTVRVNGVEKYYCRKAIFRNGTMTTMELSMPLLLSATNYVEVIYDTGGTVNMDYSFFSLERIP